MPNPSLPPRVPARKAGAQFNPWRGACGFYPPDINARQRDLGDGPKRLCERLVRWAGKNGTCWYAFDTMAAVLGKCVRQVKSDMAALETYGLINHQRPGKRITNRYAFLWHPLFDGGDVQSAAPPELRPQEGGDVQPNAHHDEEEEVQLPASDEQQTAPGDVQPAARELCHGNFVQRIASSSPQSQPGAVLTADPSDEDPFSKKAPKSPVRECLMEFVRASGIEMPVGQMPVNEIAEGLASIGATMADLVNLLKEYAGRWKDAPASWRHVLVSFQHWAADPKTHEAIRTRLVRQAIEQQLLQEKLERQRAMSTPVSYRDALAKLGGVRIPWPLEARLERTGALISPNELAGQREAWRRCRDCRDTGALGNAIDKDLRFCSCSAGEEACYRDGASWPEQEVARVHADARSLLVATCYSLEMSFTGDAIAAAEVTDDGSLLAIIPMAWHAQIRSIREGELRQVLGRIGWERSVQIGPTTKELPGVAAESPQAPAEPVPGRVEPGVVDSANCWRCGGKVILFDDGTSRDCRCLRKRGGGVDCPS